MTARTKPSKVKKKGKKKGVLGSEKGGKRD